MSEDYIEIHPPMETIYGEGHSKESLEQDLSEQYRYNSTMGGPFDTMMGRFSLARTMEVISVSGIVASFIAMAIWGFFFKYNWQLLLGSFAGLLFSFAVLFVSGNVSENASRTYNRERDNYE